MQIKKRILAWTLLLALVIGMFPNLTAQAEEIPVIPADTETEVTIDTAGAYAYFSFTPEYTESYTFYSAGSGDTYGYLYDSEMTQLAYNDDGAGNSQFSITYTLEAGVTYIWGARFYSSSATGSFTVTLQTNHTPESVVTTPATCTEDGLMTNTCTICGLVYTEVIPAGHTYESGFCSLCGEERIVTGTCGDDLTWVLRGNGTLTVSGTGYMTNYGSAARTPWYDYSADIQKIVIEEGVTTVGQYAFCGTAVAEVDFPSTVTDMSAYAFMDCVNLKSVELPEGFTYLRSTMFADCTSLTEVILPDGLEIIGKSVFSGCSSLKEIHIPDTVRVIGLGAFMSCDSLESIEIPQGVTELSERLFSGCDSLTAIALPSTIEKICDRAFEECASLTQLVIPENVVTMGKSSFFRDTALESIFFLGDAPRFIGSSSFVSASESVTIYRLADASGWEETWEGMPVELWSYEISGTADCTQAGTQILTDETHGLTYTRTILQPGHTCSAWTIAQTATAEAEGWWEGTCTVCGETARKTIPALAESEDAPASSRNSGRQNYTRYSGTVKSYLTENTDGTFTRLEYIPEHITIETYDENYVFQSRFALDFELPYFGGYYTDGEYHYIAFAQSNNSYRDNVEVLRIVRYSADWNRIDSASVYGANTTQALEAGSLRMVHYGDMLYVDTCHLMYNGHQASMLVSVHIPTMAVVDTMHITTQQEYGYVSHSFNQFIAVDEGHIVKVDHGDAYPRAILLTKYTETADNRMFTGKATLAEVWDIYGSSGNNNTGVSVGGFEVSGTHYLIAANSIVQDGSVSLSSGQRNICVIATPRDDITASASTVTWLTSYADGSGVSVSTPQFVEISKDSYLVLWTEGSVLHYAFVDGAGQLVRTSYTTEGALSDCKPVLTDDSVVWYVTTGTTPYFYEIPLDQPETLTITHGHHFVDGVCSCGAEDPAEPELFDISYASMTMGNSLAINFAFDKAELEDWTGCYAEIVKTYADGRDNVVETVPYASWSSATIGGAAHYYVTFDGVAAKEMSDEIYVTIYNADGEAISNTKTDSVRAQSMRILDTVSSEEQTMIVDMLNYGAAAQEYFNYATDDLANSLLTDTQASYASEAKTCTDIRTSSDANYYYASNVNLENSIQLMLAFKNVDTSMYAVVTYTDHYGKAKSVTIDGSDFVVNGSFYVVMVDTLVVADGRQPVICTVCKTDGTEVVSVTDSLESYTARKNGESELFTRMMQYSDSAYNFFHS